MRIGVNLVRFSKACMGDEEVYLRGLMSALAKLSPDIQFILLTDEASYDRFPQWERYPVAAVRVGLLWSGNGRARALQRAAEEAGVDCLFASIATAPPGVSMPLVLYSMDVARLLRETTASRWWGHNQLKMFRHICGKAQAVLAPSQAAQRTFMDQLDVPLNKIVIAPPGVSDVFGEAQHCFVQKPYILIVGNTEPAMNLPRTLEAFRRLRKQLANHTLVVVGRPGSAEAKEWGDDVLRFDEVPDQQLAALYQHCELFLCPAFFPASAMHVLEAMRAGARVVSARTGGIPELAGRTPVYFDPRSGKSMINAIQRVLDESEDERKQVVHAGVKRASEYTWGKCAAQTLKAFERALPTANIA